MVDIERREQKKSLAVRSVSLFIAEDEAGNNTGIVVEFHERRPVLLRRPQDVQALIDALVEYKQLVWPG